MRADLLVSTPVAWDQFIGMDPFESLYFLNSNVLFKKNSQGLQNYSDLNKGAISEVSVFNALKLALFYNDFNTVTLLDNRLAELIAIDFNRSKSLANSVPHFLWK